MRHQLDLKKLGRKGSHRLSMLRNLTVELIMKEKIFTTLQKAMCLKRIVEDVITKSKENTPHNCRMVTRKLNCKKATEKIFNVLNPRYLEDQGGYVRMLKTKLRKGDGALLALVEFV